MARQPVRSQGAGVARKAVTRIILLWAVVAFLAMYSWKDWFKATCGLVLLMAVIEHPDMPKSLMGIQGLNPWNLLLGVVVLAWLSARKKEGLRWDMPGNLNWLLVIYAGIIAVSFFRMLGDQGGFFEWTQIEGKEPPTSSSLWSEFFINTFKWVVPGLLIFDGCRDRKRFHLALGSLLAVYFLLGLQVIRWMPLEALSSGEALTERSLKIISREIGYHRVNLASMLAGAAWAIFAASALAERKSRKWLIVGASVVTFFALGLTGGRTGYGTWAVVGLIVGSIRWKKVILGMIPLVLVVAFLVPAAVERMSQGFTPETRDSNVMIHGNNQIASDEPDLYTITAGRNVAWPYVIEKIQAQPWFGYGREAMIRTGISVYLMTELGESFPHPHNAYLQLLLDCGWVGFVPVVYLFLTLVRYSLSLFRDSRDRLYMAVGGVSAALILAFLVASVGSQTFYPREGAVGMWCAIGLMLRVYVERRRIETVEVEPANGEVAPGVWKVAA